MGELTEKGKKRKRRYERKVLLKRAGICLFLFLGVGCMLASMIIGQMEDMGPEDAIKGFYIGAAFFIPVIILAAWDVTA